MVSLKGRFFYFRKGRMRMDRTVEIGYAKINLHLDITGRSDDGYHGVETVMQSLSLCDTVTVTVRDDLAITVSCDKAGVPTDESNLAVRAAKAYMEAVGAPRGLHIDIQKNIPMAAGMAGGSADAAAVLRAVNRLYGEPLSRDALCALGAKLGADVPFCIVGGSAYADGRGDRLHPFASMPDCFLVAACGGEGVSTPWAYRLLDETYADFDGTKYTPRTTETLREAMKNGDIYAVARAMYNVFEAPILAERPVARDIRAEMLSGDAIGAMMSGSGPSVFGIFDDEAKARKTAEKIAEKGYFSTVCQPVTKVFSA